MFFPFAPAPYTRRRRPTISQFEAPLRPSDRFHLGGSLARRAYIARLATLERIISHSYAVGMDRAYRLSHANGAVRPFSWNIDLFAHICARLQTTCSVSSSSALCSPRAGSLPLSVRFTVSPTASVYALHYATSHPVFQCRPSANHRPSFA